MSDNLRQRTFDERLVGPDFVTTCFRKCRANYKSRFWPHAISLQAPNSRRSEARNAPAVHPRQPTPSWEPKGPEYPAR